MFEITVKKNHPTGTRRRGGIEFSSSAPVRLEKVTKEMRADPWLVIVPVVEEKGRKSKGSDD